jgi:hypothetical protein
MKKLKMTAQILNMSIDDKIAALSVPDRAYISGYVDRAMNEYEEPHGKPRGIFVGEEIHYTGGGSPPPSNQNQRKEQIESMSNVSRRERSGA